jgi:hypothetical protein
VELQLLREMGSGRGAETADVTIDCRPRCRKQSILTPNAWRTCSANRVLVSRAWTGAGTKALRDTVDYAIRDGTVVLYGSRFHLEEASRIPDDDARRQFMEFFWCTVKWNVLLPTHELVVQEARLHRTLQGNEPFEEFWRRQELRRVSKSKADLDRLAAGVKAFVDKSVTDSAARRASATQKLEATYANLTAADVSKRWWADADTTIEDWVKDLAVDVRRSMTRRVWSST